MKVGGAHAVKVLLEAVADLVWPPECAACSSKLNQEESENISLNWLCPLCAGSVIFASKPWCTKCGIPFESEGPDHLCSTCIKDPPSFEMARSLFLYGGAIADAIQRFKYSGSTHLAKPLSRVLTTFYKPASSEEMGFHDVVVPMPLHPKRLRTRGFNQSALLAGPLARDIKSPLLIDVLDRVKDTYKQAGLTRKERMKNVKDAFEVKKPHKIEDKKILLIDDVITSTATIREAASTLLEAGANSVFALSLARSTGVAF